MATGYVSEAYESIPGNQTNAPTLSTKVMYSPINNLGWDLEAEHLNRDDENRNSDEPLAVFPDSYDPKWSGESRMYPDSLGWRLKELLGNPVTTVGNGIITDPDAVVIPAGAHRHVWTAPFGPAGASPLTTQKTVAYRDQGTFYRLKGCATDNLSIESPVSGGSMIKFGGPLLYGARLTSDPGLTPAYETLAIRPFNRAGLTLSWLAGGAVAEDFSLSIANPVEPYHSLSTSSRFPDIMEKGDGLISVSGSIPKRQINTVDWDALLNATGFAATAKWISDSIITGAYPYKFFVSLSNAQLTGGSIDPLSNKRRLGASYDFRATTAGAASVVFTLVNATASYS